MPADQDGAIRLMITMTFDDFREVTESYEQINRTQSSHSRFNFQLQRVKSNHE